MTKDQYTSIEGLIANLIRLGRLRVNTSFPATCLNGYMTESAAQNRVLSGEIIIFQNETMEIFKELINHSKCPMDVEEEGGPLSVRYVSAVLLEFVRCIFENQIPLQPAQ
jgi:hypothetical protein